MNYSETQSFSLNTGMNLGISKWGEDQECYKHKLSAGSGDMLPQ